MPRYEGSLATFETTDPSTTLVWAKGVSFPIHVNTADILAFAEIVEPDPEGRERREFVRKNAPEIWMRRGGALRDAVDAAAELWTALNEAGY